MDSRPVGMCELCGAALVQPSTGRKRRYCSDLCRKRAQRERNSFTLDGLPLADPVDASALRSYTAQALAAVLDEEPPSDPVEQLTRAVGETETLAVAYKRLARTTPRNLAVRADGMAEHLREGLDRLFPREDRA